MPEKITMTAENLRDYIGFLQSLEVGIIGEAQIAHRIVQHAPDNQKFAVAEIAKFLTMFGSVVIHQLAVIAEMQLMTLESTEKERGFP
jgi:hypothetical protein